MGDEPPTSLGGFRIERELGRGGMGIVYLAEQAGLGRKVALKVLPLAAAPTPTAVRRFEREAALVARLRHDHIVRVLEAGREQGVLYYAMEYVEGESLRERLRNGLPPRDAARIVLEVARALEHAHGRGIVHRDIKPENILLDREGRARLADFGLARAEGSETLTLAGTILGTPAYMSPEQTVRTAEVGPRSDLYSLGTVLYEALAKRPAVDPQADTVAQLRAVRESEPPRCTELHPEIPRELEAIVRMLTAKEANRRYPSATALASDLERFLRGEPVTARPPGAAYRVLRFFRKHATAAGAILALFILGDGAFVAWRLWPATIVLEADPPDALVWLDDESLPSPAGSLRQLRLKRGVHRLRLARAGYESAEIQLVIDRGERRIVPVKLRRLRQRVSIQAAPSDVRLTFHPKSGAPFTLVAPIDEALDTDSYEVIAERDGCYRRRFKLEVAKRPVFVRIYLPPAVAWRSRLPRASLSLAAQGTVAACAESGEIEILRGRDGSKIGGTSGYSFAEIVELDGRAALWVSDGAGRMSLLRWPEGTPIWSYVPSKTEPPEGRIFWPATGSGPPECWSIRPNETERIDGRTGTLLGTLPEGGAVAVLPIDEARGYVRHERRRLRRGAEERETPEFSGSIAAADLDGDGRREVIASYEDRTIRAYALDPLRELWRADAGARSMALAVGGIRPGEPPSIVGLRGDRILVLDSRGTVRAGGRVPRAATVPVLADLDADGMREIVYGSEDSLRIVNPLSLRAEAEASLPARPRSTFALSELNGDGLLDIVLPLEDGTVLAVPGVKISWEFRAGHSVRRSPAFADLNGDGTRDVVFTCLDQHVYALDGRTGRTLWRVPMENQAATTPAISRGGVVAAAWGGRVKGIQGATGRTVWTYHPTEEGWSVHFHASPTIADVDGDGTLEVLLADWRDDPQHRKDQAGAIHCVDFETGAPRWVRVVGGPFSAAPRLVAPNRIVAGDVLGGLVVLDGSGAIVHRKAMEGKFLLDARTAPDGSLSWPLSGSGSILKITASGMEVLDFGGSRNLIAWTRSGVAVSAGQRDVHGPDWIWEATGPIGSLAAGDLDGDEEDEVIVAEYHGRVTCLRGTTGERLWEFEAGTTLEAPPVVADLDGDGAPEVVLAGGDGRVLALRGRGRAWNVAWTEATGGDRFRTSAK